MKIVFCDNKTMKEIGGGFPAMQFLPRIGESVILGGIGKDIVYDVVAILHDITFQTVRVYLTAQ